MMGSKQIPDRKDLVDYNYAVAGHAGTLCDPDGELFIKPCTQKEIDFYGSANAEHADFAELMPVFMGTLLLNDATDINSINEQLPVVAEHISEHLKEEVVALAHALHPKKAPTEPSKEQGGNNQDPASAVAWAPGRNKKIATDTAIVLENSAYGFERPNILDCKLGVRLWADDAPDAKKQRFDKISSETTHRDLGFRIAGMRVYRGSEDASKLDHEEYLKYDKDWGRLDVTTATIMDAMRKFIFNPAAGIDEETGKTLAAAFVEDLKRVEEVLANEESRMYSASLLFVCEGDGDALRRAVEEAKAAAARSEKRRAEKEASRLAKAAAEAAAASSSTATTTTIPANSNSSGRSNNRVDSGIDIGEDGELIVHHEGKDGRGNGPLTTTVTITLDGRAFEDEEEEENEDEDGENGGDEDGEDGEEGDENLPRIYSLRLIDFAHADWVPGQGPDENTLKGVRSLVKIFEEMSR